MIRKGVAALTAITGGLLRGAVAMGLIILLSAGVLTLLQIAPGAEGGEIEISGVVTWQALLQRQAWLPLVGQATGAPRLTPTATPLPDLAAIEAEMAEMINARRLEGLGELAVVPELISASRVYSDDMGGNSFFSHTGSDGSTPPVRMQRAGYTRYVACAEILACGRGMTTVERVLNAWMNSPSHRDIILWGDLQQFGLGYVSAPGGYCDVYWTVDLGWPR